MKTVLFVDDEPWFHESLRYSLESKGYECLYVTDMSAAVRIMNTREIAVLVTDIMMPAGKDFPKIDSQETGFHLIKKVRAEWPGTAVVCLTVIADQEKARLVRSLQADYLRKGEVPLSTVIQTIERAAGKGGGKIWRY